MHFQPHRVRPCLSQVDESLEGQTFHAREGAAEGDWPGRCSKRLLRHLATILAATALNLMPPKMCARIPLAKENRLRNRNENHPTWGRQMLANCLNFHHPHKDRRCRLPVALNGPWKNQRELQPLMLVLRIRQSHSKQKIGVVSRKIRKQSQHAMPTETL